MMKLVVIIASTGRSAVLSRTIAHLEQQQRRPDEVVVSIADSSDAPQLSGCGLSVRLVTGARGLATQRNTAMDSLAADIDIVTFFDDDFLAAPTYLARVEQTFAQHAEIGAVHGNVVADGANTSGYTVEQGLALLAEYLAKPEEPARMYDFDCTYGCNMSFRMNHVGALRFDERLVLYGWQEDRDFSAQIGRRGRIVQISNVNGVHLGVKGGRVSGKRFGYSQIVNPIYLVRKGTMRARDAAGLVMGNLAANVVKSLRPEPWVDRRGRLIGNVLAVCHVIRGRVEPEYVLRL